MSEITFMAPIENVSGRVFKGSNVSHRTLYGKKHTYTWNPDTVVIKTPGRLLHQEAMRRASRFASDIAHNEPQDGYWHTRHRKENPEIPLNAFIIKHKLPEIKVELKSQSAE